MDDDVEKKSFLQQAILEMVKRKEEEVVFQNHYRSEYSASYDAYSDHSDYYENS
jgi:hypothetical protein